jgi:hypothetical protein
MRNLTNCGSDSDGRGLAGNACRAATGRGR